jgi:hypothetical protein
MKRWGVGAASKRNPALGAMIGFYALSWSAGSTGLKVNRPTGERNAKIRRRLTSGWYSP